MLEFPIENRNTGQTLYPPNYIHTISGQPQIQRINLLLIDLASVLIFLVQNFPAQAQVLDSSIYSQQPLQYDRFQSSFPSTVHIHHEIIVEEESMEKVFMNVNNPHLVDDDHVEYDVTVCFFYRIDSI